MLKYFLRKLTEYLEIRINCFALFDKITLIKELSTFKDILKNLKSDKEIEQIYLSLINSQIKVIDILLIKPDIEFESIINGLNFDFENITKNNSEYDDIKKISNISDDHNDLH